MPQIRVTVSEIIQLPEGSTIVYAPTGVFSHVRLPDGTSIKPWTAYEKFAPGQEYGDPEGDVDSDELLQMDVCIDLDFCREVEVVDGSVPGDHSLEEAA